MNPLLSSLEVMDAGSGQGLLDVCPDSFVQLPLQVVPNRFSEGGRGLAASKEKWLVQDHRTAKGGLPLLDPSCLTPSLRQEHLKKVTGGGETQMGPTLHSALNPELPASRHLGRSIVI